MSVEQQSVIVPDFRGHAKRKVLALCMELGLRMEGRGSGIAVSQTPLPGSRIPAGDVCQVTFAGSSAAARALVPGREVPPTSAGSGQPGLSAAARLRGTP
jgi:hypothetical protein